MIHHHKFGVVLGLLVLGFGRIPVDSPDKQTPFILEHPELVDASGWDFWTSQITQCNVDTLCIYGNNQTLFGKRFDVANAFFYSAETIAKYPGLANPPGSPGFNPTVYNPAFVTALYNGVLDRAPDSGGLQFWVGQLNQYGNYGPLLNAFLTCGEFRQRFGAADPHY